VAARVGLERGGLALAAGRVRVEVDARFERLAGPVPVVEVRAPEQARLALATPPPM